MRIALLVGIVGAISFKASAASFDCKNASSAVEKLICSDGSASDLDSQLAQAYKRALAQAPDPASLKSGQRAWLAAERNKCADVPCLKQAYQRRIAVLEAAGAPAAGAQAVDEPPYSFVRPPFISPQIINELSVGLADHGDHVIALNLGDAQGSNRFGGKIETVQAPHENLFVCFRDKVGAPAGDPTTFGYQYVGRTTSGIDVLLTKEFGGGGSGVFENLMLVRVERDGGGGSLETTGKNRVMTFKKTRWLIKKLGEFGLEDRWSGQLKVSGNEILVGKDQGLFSDRVKSPGYVVKIDPLP